MGVLVALRRGKMGMKVFYEACVVKLNIDWRLPAVIMIRCIWRGRKEIHFRSVEYPIWIP